MSYFQAYQITQSEYYASFNGAITFTDSIVAWGKLDGKIRSKPLVYAGRHLVNILLIG